MKRLPFKLFLFISILTFKILPADTNDIPAVSTGDIKFYVDHSAFKGKEGKSYLEFYLMIHADELKYDKDNREAFFNVDEEISDLKGNKIIDRSWETGASVEKDSFNLKTLAVYDQWGEYLTPGVYKISVKVSDKETLLKGIAEFLIEVPSYSSGNLSASQIEFLSAIEEPKPNSPFVKGSRSYIPNPWRRYGLFNTRLSFFYEVYNSADSDSSIEVDYKLLNKDQNIVKSINSVEVKKSAGNLAIAHAIDISNLASGVYTLNAEVRDGLSNYQSSRSFEIIQADYFTKNILNKEESELAGSLIKYIASPEEYNFYETLDLNGKANFLIKFWKDKDPDPGTPENEYLQLIKERYEYANKNFSWGGKPGWKTDRGRVLIKYGIPDETENHFSESGSSPYEVWTYTLDRSFIFVFADINFSGNYSLIHSTKEGEISNYHWKDLL